MRYGLLSPISSIPMTVTENVTLVFRYSQLDYVRAMRSHYATRLRLPMDIVAIMVMAGLGVYLWHSGSEPYGIALLCLVCLFSLMLIAAFTIIPPVAFRHEPKFRD